MNRAQMRTLGLLGGMSWESTAEYYRLINQLVRERVGGLHSAELVLVSIDFATFEPLLVREDWDAVGARLSGAAKAAERGGADIIVICTNTGHRVASTVAAAVDIPVLHIVDVVADAIDGAGLSKIGLLGTRLTMTEPFFTEHLEHRGITAIVPDEDDRSEINRIIFAELVCGIVSDSSRATLVTIVEDLVAQGAQGVILGCTELELAIGPHDTEALLFPTARLHAEAAVDFALSDFDQG